MKLKIARRACQTLFADPLASQSASSSNLMTVGVNHDTLLTGGWLDHSKGPQVLRVPDFSGRYYSVQVTDPADGTDVETLRAQYPDHPLLHSLSDETRLVVSEPLGDLAGVWNEVPESSCGIVQQGQDELRPFTPRSA